MSPSWEQAWSRFVAANGEGRYDPEEHTTEFLVSFIELLGAQGLQAMKAKSWQGDSSWQSGGNLRGADVAGGGGCGKRRRLNRKTSPLAAQLATLIKELQQSDPVKKQQWAEFCDQHANGTKDPCRHELNTLQLFVRSYVC